MNNKVKKFKEILNEKKMVDTAISCLHWDLETESPEKGQRLLAEVVGYLSSKSYDLTTSDELCSLVEDLLVEKNIDNITSLEVRELQKDIDKMKKIPADEYARYNLLTAKAQGIWAKSRENSDFDGFKDTLKEIVEFQRKFVDYRGYKGHPYNTLLDDYEPGMTVEKLDIFFGYLRKELVPLLKKIQENSHKVSNRFLFEEYPIDFQKKLSKRLAEYIGFDFKRGIISESAHPFTLNYNKDDVRLTTRYEKNYLSSSVFGTIHEGGHGLYEQGVSEDIKDSILGTGTSMGIHESQSRLYENILGRSLEFWRPIYEDFKKDFNSLKDISLNDFYRGINHSEASLIRVEADELTYSLHIMVRYEIEKLLIEGKVEVEELPRVWNEKMTEYLGVTPKNDAEGVLQDVHWSCGLFGYFPSYALGNAYASQIYTEMDRDIDVTKLLVEGELKKIREWLEKNIHRFGKMKTPNELITDISGEELNPKYYIEYIKEKYSKLYLD